MANQTRTERKHSKIKGRTQHRRGAFNSSISFSAGKKRVTFRVPAELKSKITHAARKLNISVAEFVRLAIREDLSSNKKKERFEVR